jgi:hypothetical protein
MIENDCQIFKKDSWYYNPKDQKNYQALQDEEVHFEVFLFYCRTKNEMHKIAVEKHQLVEVTKEEDPEYFL